MYDEFRRNVPAENLPQIEEKLLEPFEEREIPDIDEAARSRKPRELEQELTRLGSSLADVRRSFNEKAIASEWIRTKVKVNEEVSPDEMLEYYQAHLSELRLSDAGSLGRADGSQSRFDSPREAYAEFANMGNEVWQRGGGTARFRGPAFVEVAKAKSDGFTAKDKVGSTIGRPRVRSKRPSRSTCAVHAASRPDEPHPGDRRRASTSSACWSARKRAASRSPTCRPRFARLSRKSGSKLAVENISAKLRSDARVWTAFTGNIIGRRAAGPQAGAQSGASGRSVLLSLAGYTYPFRRPRPGTLRSSKSSGQSP